MNDSEYLNAPATKMLNSQCICCGRPLVDAVSVERAIGPECRSRVAVDSKAVCDEYRAQANELIHKAAVSAQNGEIATVLAYAEQLRDLGFFIVADKVAKRFRNASRYSEIVISIDGGDYRVETPFRRGAKKAFIKAWREIPGRRFCDNANYVPRVQKQALFKLLRRYFGGKYAKGPKGLFRIPQAEFEAVQGELPLQNVG
jgi:hypothetical protein